MKTEPEEDDIICEMPAYLSKNTPGNLQIFQYPFRPISQSYDNENIIKTQVKPQSGQVEIEVALNTHTVTFDRSTGQQIALNVDGAFRDNRPSEENYYSSDVMDKIVLTSSISACDAKRYGVGIIVDNALHIVPINSVTALHPSFSYLDLAEKQSKQDKREMSDESDSEEKATKVSVRFARPETDRSISLREKSYNYIQKKIRDEPWIPVNHHNYGSEKSDFEAQNLYCAYQNEVVDQFTLDEGSYLRELVPASPEPETINPGLPANLLSRSALNVLPLQDRIQTLMLSAGVVSFSELSAAIATGNHDEDSINVLRSVQQVAVLVQGNWVVKSDLLYHKATTVSEHGVPSEILQKARDYILYLFTKSVTVNRFEASENLNLPGPDLTDILKGISKCKGGRGIWTFLLPTDHYFIKSNPEVVQRQQMIWQSRHEQLAHTFKLKGDAKNPSARKSKPKQASR